MGKDYVEFHVEKDAEYITSNDDGGLFNWIPSAITGDHYCLISRVETEDHLAQIPLLDNIHDFSVYLRSPESMGFAQRNVSIISSGAADYVGPQELINEYDSPIEEGYLIINCDNLPAGCEVAISCPGSSSSCYLDIPRTKVTPNKEGAFSTSVHFYNMPAHFESVVYLYIWFNGNTPKSAYNVGVDFLCVETPKTAAYHLAAPLESFHMHELTTPENSGILKGESLRDYLASIGPRRAIRVGQCSYTNGLSGV